MDLKIKVQYMYKCNKNKYTVVYQLGILHTCQIFKNSKPRKIFYVYIQSVPIQKE